MTKSLIILLLLLSVSTETRIKQTVSFNPYVKSPIEVSERKYKWFKSKEFQRYYKAKRQRQYNELIKKSITI